ncbi:threonine aldolase [Rhodobium orientis]|uniref:threonine aldolase family protein n=1 Tax=Rhodobium orientis TaxID=34017 RepID=UPI0017ED71FF|nr:threonine aldolase family protein [Rhodobium orientis]MBB4301644.1 threonine aldolase [Rhodobium orientis]
MPEFTIDLVSDTSTRPSKEMLAAMAAAPTGDEQRDEDPTTLALCEEVADYLGKEAALFLPSGTMCNLIAFLVHCRPGDEIICASNAHVFGSEGGGASAVAGTQFRTVETADGIFSGADVRAFSRPRRHRSPRSRLVSVEQTTNRGGGAVWPVETLAEVAAAAKEAGLIVHMDGARLPNAAIASGRPAAEHAATVDTVWIDFSKGLGCPVGGALAGPKDFIEAAWTWKHRLGGAMRQSGVLAAAARHALKHNLERLAEDHANAAALAAGIEDIPGLEIFPTVPQSNIFFLNVAGTGKTAPQIAARMAEEGLRLGVETPTRMRAVTHLDVDRPGIDLAIGIIRRAISG